MLLAGLVLISRARAAAPHAAVAAAAAGEMLLVLQLYKYGSDFA